jgi:hypothetical protein
MRAKPEGFPEWKLSTFAPLIKWDLRTALENTSILAFVDNLQTRMLGSSVDLKSLFQDDRTVHDGHKLQTLIRSAGYGEDMDVVTARAKKQLDEVLLAGTHENLNEFTKVLCLWLGVPRISDLPRRNVSPMRARMDSKTYRDSGLLPKDIIKRIDEITHYDREIYNYAQSIWATKMKEMSNHNFISLSSCLRIMMRNTYQHFQDILPGVSLPNNLKRLFKRILHRWY